MQNPINTVPLQLFIQQVKAAEMSQQREIKLDMKAAKNLVFCISEINAKLLEDYDKVFASLMQNSGQAVSIQMDGGGFAP